MVMGRREVWAPGEACLVEGEGIGTQGPVRGEALDMVREAEEARGKGGDQCHGGGRARPCNSVLREPYLSLKGSTQKRL